MTAAGPVLVHATCVAVGGAGVLLRGGPGAGKSDLALRLIDGGAELVADDQVMLRAVAGELRAEPAPRLAGLVEVRGLGIVTLPFVTDIAVALVVDLVAPEAVDRLPEPAAETLCGCRVPRLALDPWPASAAAKVRLAVSARSRDTLRA